MHIFRLWQLYLDNVNALLKITHTPSLQGRIIEGATNVASLPPVLEALMFGIYAMAVESLGPDECQATFASVKADLLSRYQFGCQQALLNGNFLRSSDRESLAAFFLYLTSLRTTAVPSSLAALCGIAVRIAQRMGLHNEVVVAAQPPFEAEMRRRIWWALVLFDARVTELANCKATILNPTWDCKVPSNVSDADLRPEMKEPPAPQLRATDSIYAVVRSQLGEYTRHSKPYLEFTQPALKPIAKDYPDIDGIEKIMEEKHLCHCDLENPLHLITVWTARGSFAKTRLLKYYAKLTSQPSTPGRTETHRDTLMNLAFRMLECDTQILACPATKGMQWQPRTYFPFPAYVHIVQDLRARPLSAVADRAWEVMADNYEGWLAGANLTDESPFRKFSKVLTLAWDARREATNETTPPRVVAIIQRKLAELSGLSPATSDGMDLSAAPPPSFGDQDFGFLDMPDASLMGLAQPSLDVNQFTWPPVPWTMRPHGW